MMEKPDRDLQASEVIAKGVKEDFKTALDHFVECDTVRYEQFSEIWREMKMSLIFWGRLSNEENIKFVTECFAIALSFLDDAVDLQIEIGVLYLLYGLYHSQLCEPKQKIRLTKYDWLNLQTLHAKLKEGEHLDALYIYQAMVLKKCFFFCAKPKIVEYNYSGRKKERETEVREDYLNKSLIQDLLSSDNTMQLKAVHEHYIKMKCQLAGDHASEPEKSLNIIDSNLINEMDNVLNDFRNFATGKNTRHKDDNVDSDDGEEISATHSRRKAIRDKAFGGAEEKLRKDRRHRGKGTDSADHMISPKGNKKMKNQKKTSETADSDDPYPGTSQDSDILSMPLHIFTGQKGKGKKSKKGADAEAGSGSSADEGGQPKEKIKKRPSKKKKKPEKKKTLDDLEQTIKNKFKKKENTDEIWDDMMD